jgi:hypothetical protein
MAELSNGGTKTGDRTGAAVMRPAAAVSGTDSASGGALEAMWPCILSSASCSEIKPAVLNSIINSLCASRGVDGGVGQKHRIIMSDYAKEEKTADKKTIVSVNNFYRKIEIDPEINMKT